MVDLFVAKRTHDDCEGRDEEAVTVMLSGDGDAWIKTHGGKLLRFRDAGCSGGGSSPHVHAALIELFHAIEKDNGHACPATSMRDAVEVPVA